MIPLEPRALRVLLLFVQNPGKLLQKSFILETVWKTTFVEESTLTRAITILRKQLGDDPRAPNYIETVPTLCYRFIAKVEIASPTEQMETQSDPRSLPDAQVAPDLQPFRQEAEPDEVRSSEPSKVIEDGEHLASESLSPGRQRQSAQLRDWIFLFVLLLAAAGSLTVWKRHLRPVREEKRTIVISDFANSTGDAVFDGTLREGMTVQLEQSPLLSLVSESRIRSTLLLMNQPGDSRLTPVLGREVCQRTNSAAMLDGSIAPLGNQYVITLHATDCATGDSLDTEQVQVDRKEDVLRVLSGVAASLRSRLGESIASIKSLDTRLMKPQLPLSTLSRLSVNLVEWGTKAGAPPQSRLRNVRSNSTLNSRWPGPCWVACTETSDKSRPLRRARPKLTSFVTMPAITKSSSS